MVIRGKKVILDSVGGHGVNLMDEMNSISDLDALLCGFLLSLALNVIQINHQSQVI